MPPSQKSTPPASSSPDSLIALRIVHIDYYTHSLHLYSSSPAFQAARLSDHTAPPALPVIRIFGTTPARQSVCLHLHATRPYLLLSLPASTLSPEQLVSLTRVLREALEAALRASFGDGASTHAYIAEIEPVKRYDIYGYHAEPHIFLKVNVYAPMTVQSIAAIVQHGALKLPPPHPSIPPLVYEAHIPYVMQFLVDYSLAGMDYIHLRTVKFRMPMPEVPTYLQRRVGTQLQFVPAQQAIELFNAPLHQRVFVKGLEDVKKDLFWPFQVNRRSSCHLEIDAFPQDIVIRTENDNQFNFVSSTLGVIWKEEMLRKGTQLKRVVPKKRAVIAGAALSPEELKHKLRDVCETTLRGAESDDDAPTVTDSQMEHVMAYLDATQPSSSSLSQQYPVAYDDEHSVDKHDDDGEHDDGGKHDDDDLRVKRTWDEIAHCSQRPQCTPEENHRCITDDTIRALDQRAALPSQPFASAPVNAFASRSPVGTYPTSAPSVTNRAATALSASASSLRVVVPATKPPARVEILETHTQTEFAIKYETPYYGDQGDEKATDACIGGVLQVRPSGAMRYPPFPSHFEHEDDQTTITILPRVVCPVAKPPSAKELLAQQRSQTPNSSQQGRLRSAHDSAGRQIQFGQVHQLSLEQTRFPFLRLGATQRDFNWDSPTSSAPTPSAVGKDEQEPRTPPQQIVEYPRPPSPKYDEAYRITPLFDSGVKSRRSVTPRSARKSMPDTFTKKNSTLPSTQSTHLHQNITIMSIEIIASCYKGKLPDPANHAVLAVCAVTLRDEDAASKDQPSCTIFAHHQTPRRLPHFNLLCFDTEVLLFDALAAHIRGMDPDVLIGYEVQSSSVGFLIDRSRAINHPLSTACSRWLKGASSEKGNTSDNQQNHPAARYYQRKGADIKITGRHVISLWRIARKQVKLTAYSREAVASGLFGITFPKHQDHQMKEWYLSNVRFGRAVSHLAEQAYLNIAICGRLNVIGRTGELARVFGIDFMSVITRGSQYRVESMMRRVTQKRQFALLSGQREEVFRQPAVEALPLVMEPQSALYVDPVVVLDFQSLYPSVVIAHNLCFSTMLGNLNRISAWDEPRRIGVRPVYKPPSVQNLHFKPSDKVFVSSNGEMFVDSSIRRGILPMLLEEILETRVMVKTAMKSLAPGDETAHLLDDRQFGLKMIANVTYGYTSASFSGRMPCAGLADAIVQSGRDCLENIIRYIEEELRTETGATVVYGDTDSVFVHCPGATREEAFKIGKKIVAYVAKTFPNPITLKLEKVYQPCVLQTKKRYVGYSYESPDQAVPIFDAKGIETVRRDTCPLVQKALERSIRILFETRNISAVKQYVQTLCKRVHQDRISLGDYIFRREVRLGTYKEGHLPPAAIVATTAMERDPRNVPRHGERVAFVVLHEQRGAPLKDCVVSPEEFLSRMRQGSARLNTTYYITKQILPVLNRIFSLVGIRVAIWYAEMPRPTYPAVSFMMGKQKRRSIKQGNLNMYYVLEKCIVCQGKGDGHEICRNCISDPWRKQAAYYAMQTRISEDQKRISVLRRGCLECVKDRDCIACDNLMCVVHNETVKVERRLAMFHNVKEDEEVWGPS